MRIEQQRTIAKAVTCKGIGLHTGKLVTLTLKPAPENCGVIFIRKDVKESESIIHGSYLDRKSVV